MKVQSPQIVSMPIFIAVRFDDGGGSCSCECVVILTILLITIQNPLPDESLPGEVRSCQAPMRLQ